MPYGFNGTARKNALNSDAELHIAREKLAAHDAQLRARGFDPNYIGCTEAEPVRCQCCKAEIPLRVLNRYHRV